MLSKRSWEKSTKEGSQYEEAELSKKLKLQETSNDLDFLMPNNYKFPGNINKK